MRSAVGSSPRANPSLQRRARLIVGKPCAAHGNRRRPPPHAAVLLPMLALFRPDLASAQSFSFDPPGALVAGSGMGRADSTVYVPGMRFPLERGPAFANSQVWGHGGGSGPGGGQCDADNYTYPWRDNYCETRSWSMPLCPAGEGHQGQDIRPSTCAPNVHWAVAVAPGTITNIGSYSVSLQTRDGTVHRYLHMEPASVMVDVGEEVIRGQRLGRVSNAFGGTPTTYHLHYDIDMNVAGHGYVFVPPYLSLVRAYESLLTHGPDLPSCDAVPAEGAVLDNKSGCFALHGPPATWRYVADAGYDGDLYWSYTWENDASNWAEWILELDQSGLYEIEIYVTPEYAQSTEVRATIRHEGNETAIRVDQSSANGWLSIGTFALEAGKFQNVAFYDGPGEALSLQRRFVVDALRLTPIRVNGLDAGTNDAALRPDASTDEVPDAGANAIADAGAGATGADGGVEGAHPGGDFEAFGEDTDSGEGCGCSSAESSVHDRPRSFAERTHHPRSLAHSPRNHPRSPAEIALLILAVAWILLRSNASKGQTAGKHDRPSSLPRAAPGA